MRLIIIELVYLTTIILGRHSKAMVPENIKSLRKQTKQYLKKHIYNWSYLPLRHLPNGPSKTMIMIFESQELTPELIIQGYSQGIFPAPDLETDKILWHCPDPRAIIPIHDFHIPSREKRRLRQQAYQVRINTDFEGVVRACADREKTWLKPQLMECYIELHKMGSGHSVEVWKEDKLVGGLFGLQIGGFFAFISLFHYEDHTSKIATAYLLEILKVGGFTLNDCGWSTAHMEQFGVTEVPIEQF
jgi:leucyl/phenylalanyl-tRNA--protein transferase